MTECVLIGPVVHCDGIRDLRRIGPHSIPPRIPVEVLVTIEKSLLHDGDLVIFQVEECSEENGEAAIEGPASLSSSGTIRILGTCQTAPRVRGKLKVRAYLNGTDFCGESQPFVVCAHPCAVGNRFLHTENNDNGAGIKVGIDLESDSGETHDLDEVEDVEIVSESRDHSASLRDYPSSSPVTSSPQPGHIEQDDRHVLPKAKLTEIRNALRGENTGHFSNDQVDVFLCKRCGMVRHAVVPNSGYRITRTIEDLGQGRIRVRTEKRPQTVSIIETERLNLGNCVSEAGQSDPISDECIADIGATNANCAG